MNRPRVYKEFTVRLKDGEYEEEYDSRGWIDINGVEAFYIDADGCVILETECDRWQVTESIEEVLEKLNIG